MMRYKLELANEKIKNIEEYIEKNYYKLQSNEIFNDEEKEFVDNIIQNCYTQANGRRYSESVYKIALNIHAISPKALRYLRSYIPLPSTISIHNRISYEINHRFDCLLDINKVDEIIYDYKANICNIHQSTPIDCILSVDAIAFTPFHTRCFFI